MSSADQRCYILLLYVRYRPNPDKASIFHQLSSCQIIILQLAPRMYLQHAGEYTLFTFTSNRFGKAARWHRANSVPCRATSATCLQNIKLERGEKTHKTDGNYLYAVDRSSGRDVRKFNDADGANQRCKQGR